MTHAYKAVYVPAFPKPKQEKKQSPAVKVMADGREICQTGLTHASGKEGRAEYSRRKRLMWERQQGICCFYGYVPECPGHVPFNQCTFDHENKRGAGKHDDRIEVDGAWQNGVSHLACNNLVGSRRIEYNAAGNAIRARCLDEAL